jgi:hypothetical protein
VIEQAFEVATEFRFDVGQALINTKSLQGAVDSLGQSTQGALGSLNYLASGLVARLGFGSGGLLSILTKAVQVSEEFDVASLSFANNISSNFAVLTGTIDTFNDRLETSNMLMRKISGVAIGAGLDTGELAALTTKLATPLANRGKLGKNYEGAISMSKNLMIGSSMVGLHPQVASESLYRALTDRMALHGALFARLVNTPAFKSAHIARQGQLVNMNQDKKIDLLAKALGQLAGDADALSQRLHNLQVQFTIMKDHLAVLLKPIGDAVKNALINVMATANAWLKNNGEAIGKNLGALLANIFEDPRGLIINLLQIRQVGKDFKKSLHLVELYGTFRFIRYILVELLGITLNGGLVRTLFRYIWEGLSFLVALVPWTKVLSGAFKLLRVAAAEVLPPFLIFMGIMQTLSRARAIAKVNDIKNWIDLTPRMSAIILRLKIAFENILSPITYVMNAVAELIAPLFQTSTYGRILIDILEFMMPAFEFLGKVSLLATASIDGLGMALGGFVSDLVNMHNPFKSWSKNFNTGIDDFLEKNKARLGGEKMSATANFVTNVGKIEARFDMREQLEPDRIAFAVTEKLKRLAQNPKQGRGQSYAGQLAAATFAAGSAVQGAQ